MAFQDVLYPISYILGFAFNPCTRQKGINTRESSVSLCTHVMHAWAECTESNLIQPKIINWPEMTPKTLVLFFICGTFLRWSRLFTNKTSETCPHCKKYTKQNLLNNFNQYLVDLKKEEEKISVGGLSCVSSNSSGGKPPVCSVEDTTVNGLSGSKASPALPVKSIQSKHLAHWALWWAFLTEGTSMLGLLYLYFIYLFLTLRAEIYFHKRENVYYYY